jgi:hypothetical protein
MLAEFCAHQIDPQRAALDVFSAKVSAWQLDALPREDLVAAVQGQGFAGAAAALHLLEARQSGADRVFLKENEVYAYLPFVLSVAKNPSVVFMVRDPRDMAVSWMKSAPMRGGVVRAGRQWLKDQTGFMRAAAWLRPRHPVAFTTYEGLVSDPETRLRALCDTCKLEFDPAMLAFHQDHATRTDAARAGAWANLSRPVMADNVQKFRAGLCDDQLAWLEATCGKMMAGFGYAPARPAEAPPFGSFDTLAELEAHLVAREPWEKPGYQTLPLAERQRFENWSDTMSRLRASAFRKQE